VLWLPVISLCSLCASFRWLHGLIETYAEPNPDKAEVHLPIGMKSDVHTMYMDEVRCGNEDLHPVSIKHFNFVACTCAPPQSARVPQVSLPTPVCVGIQCLPQVLLSLFILFLSGLQCVRVAPR